MSLRGRDEPRYCAPVSVTKGFSRAVVLVLLVSGGAVSAEPRRTTATVKVAAKSTTKTAPKPAKTQATTPPKTQAKVETVQSDSDAKADAALAVDANGNAEAAVAIDVVADAMMQSDAVVAKIDPRMPAPTANAVMTHYQRVGREIMQLQNFRGTECTLELWKTFRAIKLEEATATKESRIATAATLQELQTRIARKKGITVKQECLDNPLAGDCL